MPVATLIQQKSYKLKQEALKRDYPRLWLAKFHHVNVHNKPMQFEDKYRFLVPLYRMEQREICIEKSVQCGASELMIVSALHEASSGLRILYVMPNIDLRGKFVKDRLDRLLKAVPHYAMQLKTALGDSTSIGLKHFGRGLLNFVGSNSTAEFVSYPADSLYIDEVDKCNQINLEMAPDRLDASEYKYKRYIGNPSVQNWGIDSHWEESTQGEWIVKCKSCMHEQTLNFFKNVIVKTGEIAFDVLDREDGMVYAVCQKCGARLDRMKKGKWVHAYPDRDKKGFRINQLFSANVTLESLVKQYGKAVGSAKKLQIFINSKLGLPFSSSENKITYDLLKKAETKQIYSLNSVNTLTFKRVYVGIDVGTYYHVVVRGTLDNGMRKLIDVRKIEVTQHLVNYLKKLRNIKFIVIDEMPEIREVEKIKKQVKKTYSCLYRMGRTILDLRKAREEWRVEKRISIDRTFILDEVKADFARQQMINPVDAADIYNEDLEDFGEYYQNLLSSTRIFVETAGQNRGKFEWRESGPDHFLHAEAYCKLAEMIDPNMMQFYKDRTAEYSQHTKEETDAEYEKSKVLIPRVSVSDMKAINKGEMKPEDSEAMKDLSIITAETFLRDMFFHTEEFLGKRKGRP